MKEGKLIVVSAPSGSGKSTLVHALLKQNLPLAFSISATSRSPRGKEKDGVDYHFLTPEAFQKKIAENAFVEYEEVYPDKFYGTLREELQNKRSTGQHIIFDIDVVGGINIKSQYPEDTLSIFVQAPNLKVLEERLRLRATEDEALIQERLAKAQLEMESSTEFDVVIVNEDLEQAKKEIYKRVKAFINS
ncbi:MAG: guanylate kinase [Flavobacteriaceae bacterium]